MTFLLKLFRNDGTISNRIPDESFQDIVNTIRTIECGSLKDHVESIVITLDDGSSFVWTPEGS